MASSAVEICDLPNEILCEIFTKLTPEEVVKYVVNVCNRWNIIVKENKRFWNHVQLTVHCDYFINCSYLDEESTDTDKSLQSLYPNDVLIGEKDLEKVSSLRCIKLTEGTKAISLPALLVMRIIDIISKTCQNLDKFEFTRCFGATSKEFFQFLRQRYSQISEIRFGVCSTYIIPYSEISKFKNITTLVTHDYAFKRSDLKVLADGCETLSCLWILFSRSPKDDDILYFLNRKKNVLKELGLGMIVNDIIILTLKECFKLEVLFLADTRFVTDDCIKLFTNLPRLKYCSLQRARFKLDTALGMVDKMSTGISPHLVILDLTGYRFTTDFILQIIQRKETKFVTFENDVNTAIKIPWHTKSQIHWMYRNKTILKDFEFWMREGVLYKPC